MLKTIRRKIPTIIRSLVRKYRSTKRRYQILIPLAFVLLLVYCFCLPSPLFDVPYSTVVSDRNGELLGARIAKDQQWRFPTTDSISEKYKTCLIEFEDKHFEYHWGINPVSVLRAFKQNILQQKIVSGASTITMQTIRMSRKESRTFSEKFVEIILATRLEFSYSKDEILNLYASHAPMGGNVVGIDAASWRYFGHDAKDLSWAEAATLAVLPNSPSLIHFGRNRDRLLNKRNKLLSQIRAKGIIDNIDFELATSEPLTPHPYALPQIAPHLVTKIYLEEEGKRVTSTIEKYQQQRLELILNRWNAEFSQNGINNIAALVIDIEKNEILGYCGNVHFDKNISANQVDIIQAPRSTGSILKPFLYCAMLQEGELLPDELVADVPLNLNGFSPKNYSLKYDGAAPASEALARSLNIPSVVSLRKYSVPKFYNLLQNGGMTSLSHPPSYYGLSLILGGCEGRLLEICDMYSQLIGAIEDYNTHGEYYKHSKPNYVLQVDVKKEKETVSNPLFKAGAAWLTLEALTNVNRPEEIDWKSIPSMQKIAWKTGTSFGARDGWAVGVNRKYVVGVWVGNSSGEGRPGLTGAQTSGMVMFDIFNSLPKSGWIEEPTSDLILTEICKKSGLLRGINCPESSIEKRHIPKRGVHATACPYHKLVHLSKDMNYQVYNDCAGTRGIIHRSWFVLPTRWEWYYKEQHTSYKSLPPYSPECLNNSNTPTMEFIYPYYNTSVKLPKQLDGSDGQIIFELAHRSPQKRVFWHLDSEYIGETSSFHKKSYAPSKGKHRLTAVDEDGISISINFTVM